MRIEPETGVGQAASLFGERSSPWASYARLCRQEHWRSLTGTSLAPETMAGGGQGSKAGGLRGRRRLRACPTRFLESADTARMSACATRISGGERSSPILLGLKS